MADPIDQIEQEIRAECETETYVKPEVSGYPSTKGALEKAKEQDLKVVYPMLNELQLDIDSPEDYATWQAQRSILDQYMGVLKVTETPSKDKGHLHITVTLNKRLNAFERIAFQAVMGSDRKRELLGLIMNKYAYVTQPTLFLEKK